MHLRTVRYSIIIESQNNIFTETIKNIVLDQITSHYADTVGIFWSDEGSWPTPYVNGVIRPGWLLSQNLRWAYGLEFTPRVITIAVNMDHNENMPSH